jgi:Na+/proline symporter
VGLIKIGGFNVLLDTLSQLNPTLIDPFSLSMGAFFGFIGIGLGSPGQPHIVVRYMSIDDPNKLKYSTVIGTTWNVIMAWGAVFIGLLARILVPEVKNLPNADKEMVYLVLSSQYFGSVFYGLLVGGVFAAILSTADSQLLVVASTFVRDIYEKIYYERTRKRKSRPQLSESRKLMLSRVVVFISGILAIILAYVAQETIFWLVLFAWGGLGASLGTSLIFSLYWKRTSKYGIFAGMIVGTAVTIVWKLFLKDTTGIYELIPAFFGSALAIFIVSLLIRTKHK